MADRVNDSDKDFSDGERGIVTCFSINRRHANGEDQKKSADELVYQTLHKT